MKKKLLFGAFGALLLCGGIAAISIKNAEASCEVKGPVVTFRCDGNDGRCSGTKYGHTITCSGKDVTKKISEVEDTGTL